MIRMNRRSDGSIATLLLTHQLSDRAGKPLTSKEYWDLLGTLPDPADLLGFSASDVHMKTGCSFEQAFRCAALLNEANRLAFLLEELEQTGLRIVTAFDEGYPDRLRKRLQTSAPAVLHVAGSSSVLDGDGVGVVGSRRAHPEALEVAAAVARIASGSSLATVSGGARGIDAAAMAAARSAGGTVVGVLAESLLRRLADAETRRGVLDGEVCLLTPYKPSAPFSVGNAMGRNKLIYALSRVTVVVASDDGEGGTWAGATEALSRGFGRVAVWTGAGAGLGNRPLVARGGEAVDEIGPNLLADCPATSDIAPSPVQLGLLI